MGAGFHNLAIYKNRRSPGNTCHPAGVGIVFDSNIEGLVSDYDFNYSPQARAVSVHSAGILEILKKIYRADRLVKELTRN